MTIVVYACFYLVTHILVLFTTMVGGITSIKSVISALVLLYQNGPITPPSTMTSLARLYALLILHSTIDATDSISFYRFFRGVKWLPVPHRFYLVLLMGMESLPDIEQTRLVLIKRFCGVLSWHFRAGTSAEMTLFMHSTRIPPRRCCLLRYRA